MIVLLTEPAKMELALVILLGLEHHVIDWNVQTIVPKEVIVMLVRMVNDNVSVPKDGQDWIVQKLLQELHTPMHTLIIHYSKQINQVLTIKNKQDGLIIM